MIVIKRAKIKDKRIALTFDDGPHADYTKSILHTLNQAGVKATFFVIGKEAEKYPELIKLMAQNDHEVCNHSYYHSKNGSFADVKKTEKVIESILGVSAKLFRPPWGKVTLVRLWCALLNNIKIVLWSYDSMDHKFNIPQELKGYIKQSKIKAGDILLFHEDYKHTQEALPDIIADLKSRGFRFNTVSELLI